MQYIRINYVKEHKLKVQWQSRETQNKVSNYNRQEAT